MISTQHTFTLEALFADESPANSQQAQLKSTNDIRIQANRQDMITSAKEVMFSPLYVCLCVSRVTQKLVDEF